MDPTSFDDIVEPFIRFYRNYYRDEIADLAQQYPDDQRSLIIDYHDLFQFDEDLASGYVNHPEKMRAYAEEALRQYELPESVKLANAHVRLSNLPETTSLHSIQSDDVNEAIQITGRVTNTTSTTSEYTSAVFECRQCGTEHSISKDPQPRNNTNKQPRECMHEDCDANEGFSLDQGESSLVDTQTIVVEQQESGITDSDDTETIEVYLIEDITEAVSVGDTVTVTGILTQTDQHTQTTISDKYLRAIHIKPVDTHEIIDINDTDIEDIEDIADRGSVYDDIIGSIAPTIKGHETEKLALALQLFSGVQKTLPDGSTTRGDIHVLLIGDPGTAKSAFLNTVKRLSTHNISTSGSDTTSAGLTASASQSGIGEDTWSIKGGVLAKAHGGVAVIDNLDSFDTSHFDGLHSVLEDQIIEVSKASVNQTLPAKTSVLAAANPKYGRFDDYESIGEQIDIPSEVVSQFDLLFIFNDDLESGEDAEVAEHILMKNQVGEKLTQQDTLNQTNTDRSKEDHNELAEMMTPDIDHDTLQKYISYAKQSYHPTMTTEAKQEIKEFYLNIRSSDSEEESFIPVTARKLESIIRLAEASARMRLSDSIEMADAKRAIGVIRTSLRTLGIDTEANEHDADMVETGQSKTQRGRLKSLLTIVNELEDEDGYEDGVPYDEVLEEAEENGMSEDKAEKEIEKLRRNGKLYEPIRNHLRTS